MSYGPLPLSFSAAHSEKRMAQAARTLGEAVVKRLLAFALFLMGARREEIARHLAIPPGTLFSLLTRIGQTGLPALEDRRSRHSAFLPSPLREPSVEITADESQLRLEFAPGFPLLTIPRSNALQVKTVLLTFLQNGWLTCSEVARQLDYSPTHTARMARQLAQNDVEALRDQRAGRSQDYRVTAAVKAELIQQFVLDLVTTGHTSGSRIAQQLQARCQIDVSDRTVRHHLTALGLSKIKHSLPELLAAVKKTPNPDPPGEGSFPGPDRG